MGGSSINLKQKLKAIILIVRSRRFTLLPYLASIDSEYLIQAYGRRFETIERCLHPLFDPIYYRHRYLDKTFEDNAFSHFLTKGIKKGYKPGPFFDYDVYEKERGWDPEFQNPFIHYIQSKQTAGSTGVFFDADWYVDKTPILHKLKLDPLKHFILHGSQEGKSPIPLFVPEFYRQFMDDSDPSMEPLSSYLTFGVDAKIPPSEFFDPEFYEQSYGPELEKFFPFEHYLRKGVYDKYYSSGKVAELQTKPLISIIVPVFNPDPSLLNSCIRSVLYQHYPNWQLCLVDDGSTRDDTRACLAQWQKRDRRIEVVYREENEGISSASNAGAAIANGEYFGFLDNDDELAPDALFQVVATIAESEADILYTDEDLVGDDGRRFSCFHKPSFNGGLLYSHNYVTHFMVVKRQLFETCNGFRPECDGAQDYDLLLRTSAAAKKIVHIPKILYHWRATKTSTSINHTQKGYAHEAGKQALQSFFDKTGAGWIVDDSTINYSYHVKRKLEAEPTVTVLVWDDTTDKDQHVLSIESRTNYRNCIFQIVTPSTITGHQGVVGEKQQIGEKVYTLRIGRDDNKAYGYDQGVQQSESDFLVFLDSSVIDVDPEWLAELITTFFLPNIGIACGRVAFRDGDGPSYTLPELDSKSARYYYQFLTSSSRHLNGLHNMQHLRFVPWENSAIRRTDYVRLGGFSHQLYPHLFGMTDLALKLSSEHYASCYNPFAKIVVTQEQASRDENVDGRGLSHRQELNAFLNNWKEMLKQLDPNYNRGILDEHKVDRDAFFKWFTGGISNTVLS